MDMKIKIFLLCSVASSVALSANARAQESSVAGTGGEEDAIVVTGSRVITNGADSPTPVTVISPEQLQATTTSNIPDALNKLPVFMGSSSQRTIGNSNSNASGNTLNLRNFGANRTLVLFDGRRVAPSNPDGSVDVDILPEMLMSRVDVVTGGASAVYGSDAVSGVVNYILDKNFSGIKYKANVGISDYRDGFQRQIGVAAGTDLFGGRAHLEGSARYFKQDMIRMDARPWAQNGLAWTLTGAGTESNPFVDVPYGRQAVQGASAHIIDCGGCAAEGMQFIRNGVIGPYNPGDPTGSGGINNGGDGGMDSDSTFQAALKTKSVFGRFSYDLTDTTTAYINVSAAEADNFTEWDEFNINPSTTRPNTYFVDNPYIPAEAQALLANPTGTFTIAGRIATVIQGERARDRRMTYDSVSNNRNNGVTVGVDGKIAGQYNWSLYYSHYNNRLKVTQPNNTNNQKLYAAMDGVLDASGNPICYVNTTPYSDLYTGCVPISPFGPDMMTTDQYRWISEENWFTATSTMDDIGASVAGKLFELPAGPVQAALSGEMRWMGYDVDSNLNPTQKVDCTGLRLCNPATSITVQAAVAPMSASDKVYEFAGEVNLPLLKDVPLAQSLSMNVAGRYTHYSISGSVGTWKVGLDDNISDSIRLRATMSRDIRAPNLNDLFAPLKETNSGFHDYLTDQTFSVVSKSQGNPDLKPEVARTFTGGIVITPTAVPRLMISLDYVRINLKDAITTVGYGSETIQNLCVSSGGTSIYCSLVSRPISYTDTSPANFPTSVSSMALNSASIKTESVDFEADYGFDMANIKDSIPGSINLRFFLSYQPYIKTLDFPGAPVTRGVMPKTRSTAFLTYKIASWRLNLQNTWFSGFSRVTTKGQVYAQPRVKSFDTVDVSIEKEFTVSGHPLSLYLSIQNVANTQPPLYVTNTWGPGNTNPVSPYENGMGRFYTLGVRGSF